jgi:hypothetical protein
MKRLTPIPREWAAHLKRQNETGMGYHVVSVTLKSDKRFEQVIASEGCVIHVQGHKEVPFRSEEVASVDLNHKRWNFREEI